MTQQFETPCISVKRSVYEHLGAFDTRLTFTEDWEMWARIAAQYPIYYIAEPLAVYRRFSAQNNTGRNTLTGETTLDCHRALTIIHKYQELSEAEKDESFDRHAHLSVMGFLVCLKSRSLEGALVHWQNGYKLCRKLPTKALFIYLYFIYGINKLTGWYVHPKIFKKNRSIIF